MHSRARDQAQLAAKTRRFFHRRQRQPRIIYGCFGGLTSATVHPRIEPIEFRINKVGDRSDKSSLKPPSGSTRRGLQL